MAKAILWYASLLSVYVRVHSLWYIFVIYTFLFHLSACIRSGFGAYHAVVGCDFWLGYVCDVNLIPGML